MASPRFGPPPALIAGEDELAGVQPFGTAPRRRGRAAQPAAPPTEAGPRGGRAADIDQLRDKVRQLAQIATEIADLLRVIQPAAVGLLRPVLEAGMTIERIVIEGEQRRGEPGGSPAAPTGPVPSPTEGAPPGLTP